MTSGQVTCRWRSLHSGTFLLLAAVFHSVPVVAAETPSAGARSAMAVMRPDPKSPPPWLPEGSAAECLFLSRTAIPLLAMGVRTLDDGPDLLGRQLLDLWGRPEAPDPGATPRMRVPLYRPYFVYHKQRDADVTTWHLLGDALAGAPLGWADGRQLRLLESRYGYSFSNPRRLSSGVHLYRSRKAAYAALEAQSKVPPETPLQDVVVVERIEEERWDPSAADAISPFIELADDEDLTDRNAAGLTDTTLSFPFRGENRLVCLGAVAGGPVDRAAIARKKASADERAGIAMMFVIDETRSMKDFFGGVAKFIDQNLDLGENAVNVRVAVSWYSDTEKRGDTPYVVQPLQAINGPGVSAAATQAAKQRIVDSVGGHEPRIIGGLGAQPEELIYPGLVAAIEAAGFEQGENAMVFVIGDAADRHELEQDPSLRKAFFAQQAKLTELIKKHALQVAFVQVGEATLVGTGFTEQASRFRKSLKPELQSAVIVQGPGSTPLQNRIAELQSQMDRRRTTLLAEVAEMETRHRFSAPGPALEQEFPARQLDRERFDRSHLQLFVPAWGWLYHPQRAEALPQLREFVFLARSESEALVPALAKAAEGLAADGRVDVEAARALLSETLRRQSGHGGVAIAIDAAWQSLPKDDRTLGRFLEQGMGLRVRNPLLFHRGMVNPKAAPTRQSSASLLDSRNRIRSALQAGGSWVDAWEVLP